VPEHHVDGVTGRMRLVKRGVEMSESEGEVDRVDIFQGRGERRNVRG
jgi:hypothetical protein